MRYIYRKWNRIDSPVINPFIYDQLTFDVSAKTIQQRKNGIFNKQCWDTGYPQGEVVGPVSYTIHKNLKWIKDTNLRAETFKILRTTYM